MPTGENRASNTSSTPLAGLRVVEFGHVAAAPFGGMLLADLGADVVKIEPRIGDQMRQWPPLVTDGEGRSFSHNFGSLNRNKRSIVLDLKDRAERDIARGLVAQADVLIANYRPGVLDRLGLGFDEVSRDHAGIVYCSISGFGVTSNMASKGAFDVVVQGMSGLMSVTGTRKGELVKCGVPVADMMAGLYAAFSIVSARRAVEATGQSIHLDCAMLNCLVAAAALQTSEFVGTGRVPEPLGSAHPRNAPYQVFTAADGPFSLAAGNDSLWTKVCEVIGMPELAADPRFLCQVDRAANQSELVAILAPQFERESVEYWLKEFDARGVPSGPVLTYDEVLASDPMKESGMLHTIDMPVIGPTTAVGFPVRFLGSDPGPRRSAPELDQHRDEVLADWEVGPARI